MSVQAIKMQLQGIDWFGVAAYRGDGRESRFGIRGQCVEFARRWYVRQKKITFASVPRALDLWDLKSAFCLRHHQSVPFVKGHGPPPVGALLIYDRSAAWPDGHVAVVIGRRGSYVYVSEQNYSAHMWQRYARRFKWQGERVLGWMLAQ